MTFAQVTSEQVVSAYIERIKEVNPYVNAVVEDRFEAAIEDARRADRLVQTTSEFVLVTNYPILGVPFTVKESCSLKGKQTAQIWSHSLPLRLGSIGRIDLCASFSFHS